MARKILDDEGRISEDSEIYEQNKKENQKTHKEQIKELTPAQKWQYFKDYHLKNVLIVLAIIALVVFAYKDKFSEKDYVLHIAIEDSVYNEKQIDKMEKSIKKALGLPDDQYIEVTADYVSDNYNYIQKLQTYLHAGTVDIVISNDEAIKWYSESGFFMDPELYKYVSFYENYDDADRFYSIFRTGESIRGEEDVSEEKYNYGLYLDKSDVYKKFGGIYEGKQVIAINVNTKNPEYSAAAVKYLMGE